MQFVYTFEWPGQYLDDPFVRIEERVVAVPAQGPAHPGSSDVCQPQPVSSAASTSCLQEGPTSTIFFHFLCFSWCFRVADYSRPVAMADSDSDSDSDSYSDSECVRYSMELSLSQNQVLVTVIVK